MARDSALGDLEVASSLIIVNQLAVDEMLVEIEAIAAKAGVVQPARNSSASSLNSSPRGEPLRQTRAISRLGVL